MSNLSTQLRWLRETVAVRRLDDQVVHVRGDDAKSWLNGQVSNDVRELADQQAKYALTLTVKGRIVSDLWALSEPPGMAFVLPAARAEAALARFEQHIIMEDVELAPDPELCVLTLQGPRAEEALRALPTELRRYPCARVAAVGFDCWVPRAQLDDVWTKLLTAAQSLDGGALDDAGWAEAHVAFGVPRLGIDFGEDSYPQEAGLGARALSFGKGCYLGQEVVYMLENRGQLARRLVQLELPRAASPAAGALLVDADGKKLGELTSLSGDPGGEHALGLAYLKRAASEPGHTVWLAGSPVRVVAVVGAAVPDAAREISS